MIELTLPWPPSVNRYWRSVNGRVLIAAAGRRYRTDVELAYRLGRAGGAGMGDAPVQVVIEAWLPDLRRRDIDNLLKAPLDALTHAGLWDDDSQVMALAIRKAGMDRVRPRLEIAIDIDSPPAANQGNRHVR
jgi:crossover junction endodeoxyribonuclease RusA